VAPTATSVAVRTVVFQRFIVGLLYDRTGLFQAFLTV
jgi:hypothetical protein